MQPKRPLSPKEAETLARFDKWLKRLFFHTVMAIAGRIPAFSTKVHPDNQGNLLIDHGRMILQPPDNEAGEWRIVDLTGEGAVEDKPLEEALLKALDKAIRRNFKDHY